MLTAIIVSLAIIACFAIAAGLVLLMQDQMRREHRRMVKELQLARLDGARLAVLMAERKPVVAKTTTMERPFPSPFPSPFTF